MTEAEEKQRITQRLRDYRKAHGLGCFAELAKAIKSKKISSLRLLELQYGEGDSMLLSEWRKIERALDSWEGEV